MSDPELRRKLQIIIGYLRIGLSKAKRSRAQEQAYLNARAAAVNMGCGMYGDPAEKILVQVRAKLEALDGQN